MFDFVRVDEEKVERKRKEKENEIYQLHIKNTNIQYFISKAKDLNGTLDIKSTEALEKYNKAFERELKNSLVLCFTIKEVTELIFLHSIEKESSYLCFQQAIKKIEELITKKTLLHKENQEKITKLNE